MNAPQSIDVLILGAGPAGLIAALYVRRFRRTLRLFNAGASRASHIPVSHNCPGFAAGVSGPDYLHELRAQCARHGITVEPHAVTALRRDADRFVADTGNATVSARNVVFATGIEDRLPPIEDIAQGIRRGRVRLCPVCDAYEADDQSLLVYGPAQHAVAEARYLRAFAPTVTLALEGEIADAEAESLAAVGVTLLRGPGIPRVHDTHVELAGRRFDAVYPAMGALPRAGLARSLGASCTADGYLRTDAHQQTDVPGLFAVGDVAEGLNQIAVGAGQAATAASAIHRALPARLLDRRA
jgi:thioredoxin reductase (NADPH)